MFYLHTLLSLAIFATTLMFPFSQTSMSWIHCLLGHPLPLVPDMASTIISFSKSLSALHFVCPWHFNFLVLILGMSCSLLSISLRMVSFVLFLCPWYSSDFYISCHLKCLDVILEVFLQHSALTLVCCYWPDQGGNNSHFHGTGQLVAFLYPVIHIESA